MALSEPDSTGTLAVKGPENEGRAVVSRLPFGNILQSVSEVEGRRLTIWSPVLLVCGIWAYFALGTEPGWTLVAVLVVAGLLAAWRWLDVPAVIAVAIVIAGFAAAKGRTAWVDTPVVRAYSPDVKITGRVADVDRPSAKRLTLVIDVVTAIGLPPDEVPRKIRVQATGALVPPQIGDGISGTTLLLPLPLPVAPGAFDFGRGLYFQSIGATGRFTAPFTSASADVPWRYQLRRGFHGLRSAIGVRVKSVIKGPLGSFADALITGERAQIPRAMNESLQSSGLFHVLSISGLHMAMVAGSAFWVIRALLALFPALALRSPIKKWAAGAALGVGLFYMLLADGGAATERSFIMIAVMFFAVMVDRAAISLHNLAVAAVFILLFSPEQAVAASFQMSFLAVMGLAAFFEWWNARVVTGVPVQRHVFWRAGRWLVLVAGASLATSLIAGLLSGIPAAHHFGRIAPYGMIGNALALPVVSVAVMPMALLATLLMPLGLEALPLNIMEQGLQLVMVISDWVASWPAAGIALPLLPVAAAAGLAFAAALASMAKSALRWLALPAVVAGVWFTMAGAQPDILVEERARVIAAVNGEGFLVPTPGKESRFAVGRWLQQRGQQEKPGAAEKRALWTCEGTVCRAEVEGRRVVVLRETADPVRVCPVADIVIADYPLRRRCKGKLATIDRFDVWRGGAHAIKLHDTGIEVVRVRDLQGRRPWVIQPRPRTKR